MSCHLNAFFISLFNEQSNHAKASIKLQPIKKSIKKVVGEKYTNKVTKVILVIILLQGFNCGSNRFVEKMLV